MFKHSLYPGSYFAEIILPIPATHFENTTFLFGPIYMEDPVSVAKILPEKINKMFLPNKLGFIDVLSTVTWCANVFAWCYLTGRLL